MRSTALRKSGLGMHCAGAVLAFVALVGQLLGSAHLAFTPHATCAEHGELVELRSTAGSATPGNYATSTKGPSASRDDSSVAHGHDHCPCTLLQRERLLFSPRAQCSCATTQATVAIFAGIDSPTRSIALILLAPKNSPPV
jgi:hypothetical protein